MNIDQTLNYEGLPDITRSGDVEKNPGPGFETKLLTALAKGETHEEITAYAKEFKEKHDERAAYVVEAYEKIT